MSEEGHGMVKPGDLVMVGPVEVLIDNSVDHFNGQKPGTNWVTAFMTEHSYPWHPALANVARWLAQLPQSGELNGSMDGVVEHMSKAFEQYFRNNVFTRDCGTSKELQAMRSLIAALTPATEGA